MGEKHLIVMLKRTNSYFFFRILGLFVHPVSGLSRRPLGMRGKICQKVETTKSRITLQSLTEWIEKRDVIKHKGIKAYRDKDIEKNTIDTTY